MKQEYSNIRIYVACLAAYNNGILHGQWIEATWGEEHMREIVREVLQSSPIPDAEEYAIHDYEGFEGATIEEYQPLESVAEIAEFISEHGALGGKLIEYFGDLDDARKAIDENYAGFYASLKDFAQETTEETTQIPENIQYYIDYDRMARDIEINDVLAIETGFEEVHIFWRH